MKGYKHLDHRDRLQLERLLKDGYSKKELAVILGCSLSTIYNELRRGACEHMNSDLTVTMRYDAYYAQRNYEKHLREKGQTPKILKDERLRNYISDLIGQQHFSPDAVLMEIENNGIEFSEKIRSVHTIYNAIRRGDIPGVTMKDLPRGGKVKQKKQKVEPEPAYWREQKGKSIDERPEEVLSRTVFGHWEMDSVIGRSINRKTALVLTERKTRVEIIEKMRFHTMDEVCKALNRIEKRFGGDFYKVFKSITVDNGSEFKDYERMEKALRRVGKRTTIYYCHARAPNERGTNENNNILLRRCEGLRKGADFDKCLTTAKCKDAEAWINTYPRRIFGGRCSLELFNKELVILGCRPIEY